MSKEIVAVGHDFATKRYRQIFGLLTVPSRNMIVARIAEKLCDFWIRVESRGHATVYRFSEHPITGKVW